MRKSHSFVLCLLAAVTLSAQNLLFNPQLAEPNAKGIPKGWWTPCKTLQLTVEDGVFTLTSESERPIIVQNFSPKVIIGGKPYRFTCQIRAQVKTNAQNYIEYKFPGEDGKSVRRSYSTQPFEVGTNWKEHMMTFILPDNYTSGHIVFGAQKGKSVIQYKDIVLKEANIRKDIGGFWDMDTLAEIHPKGIIATRDKPAVLHDVPVVPGKAYTFKYNAIGIGQTGNDYPFHEMVVKTNPSTLQGGYFFNDVMNTTMPKVQKITIPANYSRKTIDFEFQANTKGKILFSDFEFTEFVPDVTADWRLELDEPFYRDMIYSRTDTGRIAGTVLASAPAASITAEVIGIGKTTATFADGKASFAIPAPNLPVGSYTLTVRVLSADNKEHKSFTRNIKKLPPAPVEIIANRNRYLEINGKPFFPVMQWKMDFFKDEAAIYEAARNGINSTKTFPKDITQNSIEDLDRLHKFGLKAILTPLICARNMSPAHLKQIREMMEKRLPKEVREHPAVIGYFLVDEPLWGGKPIAPIRATYEMYKELDPYKPVWINAAPRNEIEDLRPYAEACDIWGVDIYPIPSPNSHSGLADKGITSVGKYTVRMNEVTYWRKPIFMALQGFAWAGLNPNNSIDKHVYPTLTQMRFMNYETVLNGGSVGWWGTQYIKSKPFYRAMFDSALELHKLSGLLINGKQQPDLATDNAAVRVVPFTLNGNTTYFLLNLTDKESTVSFAVNGTVPLSDTFTGQSHPVADGKVTVTLAAYTPACISSEPLPPPAYDITPENPAYPPMAIEKFIDESLDFNKNYTPYNGKANWIWDKDLHKVNESAIMCTRAFDISDITQTTKLLISSDDVAVIYINGKQLPEESRWWDNMIQITINKYLVKGKNRIVLKAKDSGTLPCGILAEIRVNDKPIVETDSSWLTRPSTADDTDIASANGYRPAHVVTPYGGGAWGKKVRILKEGVKLD